MSQFCAVAIASRCGELVGYKKGWETEWLSNCNPLMVYQNISPSTHQILNRYPYLVSLWWPLVIK